MSLALEDIRLLRRIAEVGRMAAVARETKLSPATISARLKAAEEHLGVRLFLRTTRSLSLTEEGRRFMAASERLVGEWESLADAVRGGGAPLAGLIRVTAPFDLGMQHVAPLLEDFQRDHPQVVVDLDLTDAMVDLVAAGVDLAIRGGSLADSGLRARRLAATRPVVVAAPAYLERAGRPESPPDLARHRCIVRRSGDRLVDEWSFQRDGEPLVVRVRPALVCNNGAQTRQWAVAGAGLTTKICVDVVDDVRAGRLVKVLEDWSPPPLPLMLVSPPQRLEPMRVAALRDRLVTRFAALADGEYSPYLPVLTR